MADHYPPQNRQPQRRSNVAESRSSNREDAARNLADVVYVALAGSWPMFTRDYGVEPTSAWLVVLEGLTLSTVEDALRRVIQSANPRPPTPGQFLSVCKDIDRAKAARLPADGVRQSKDQADEAEIRRLCGFMLAKRILKRIGLSDSDAYLGFKPAERIAGYPYERVVGGVALDDLPLAGGDRKAHDAAYERLWARVADGVALWREAA